MSRVFGLLAALFLLAGSACATPSLLFDARTGEVLLAQEAGEPWHPASLTKLMTAYLSFQALKAGKITLQQKLTVSKQASEPPPSKIGMQPGSTVTVDFALRALLVHSANDMAVVLAEGVGGNLPQFVQMMNTTAERLGMSATHYANPHGLHDLQQVSSARDIGVLAALIVNEFPEYRHYFAEPFLAVGKRKLRNRNMLLRQMPEADGMKTGFVCPSGFNLVASASRGGRQLIAVLLGTRNAVVRADMAQLLLESGLTGRSRSQVLLAQLPNRAGVAPPNLKAQICGSRGAVMAKASEIGGWGVSFGRYKDWSKADGVLEGQRVLNGSGMKFPSSGILRVPFSKEFIALAWAFDKSSSQALCRTLQARNNHCEVVAPEALAEFSRLALQEQQQRRSKTQKATAQRGTAAPTDGTAGDAGEQLQPRPAATKRKRQPAAQRK